MVEPTKHFPDHTRAIVLFDGVCNLCNYVVDFILRRPNNRRFRFAALQSEAGRVLLRRHREALRITGEFTETLVLIEDTTVTTRSRAAFRVFALLGWPWKSLCVFSFLPLILTDFLYDLLARNRYRLLGRRDQCRFPTSRELSLFLDGSETLVVKGAGMEASRELSGGTSKRSDVECRITNCTDIRGEHLVAYSVETRTGSRVLLGPGPSNVDPRVLRVMSSPLLGHLDPDFLGIMNEIQDMLRQLFRTTNELTIPISGTGSAGMEAAILNVVEPGDSVLICEAGVFGQRMAEMARRSGGNVHVLKGEWGKPIDNEELDQMARSCRPRVIAMVHAETSTGVHQPLKKAAAVAREHSALLIVDAVTSLGGHTLEVDALGIDVCYSGTQKCISCPPGLAPITVSDAAAKKLRNRKSSVLSWYLDLTLVASYWGSDRTYHHTAPITMNYALHEALRIILEEGLEQRARRHERNHNALVAGLQAMGLQMLVEPSYRLWSLNAVRIPNGVDDGRVRRQLLEQFKIEIGGGLGVFKSKIWRIGLMGSSSTRNNVYLLISALEQCLLDQGFDLRPGAGLSAVGEVYGQENRSAELHR